jgi:tRNA(Ile)-lysidine synthase
MNYLIALSGGLDSIVLLNLMRKQFAPTALRAIHIHHGLSVNANAWVSHCEKICSECGIPLIVEYVTLNIKPGRSLEELARKARYDAFTKVLQPNEILVTAHHQNDQAETFLLHAIRGGGPKGLAAMPVLKLFDKNTHWRPLLNLTRDALLDYAARNQLSWINDESNENIIFDRNFLRHEIIPKLKQRWPKVIENLTRATEIQAEVSNFLDEQLAPSWSNIAAHIERLNVHRYYKQGNILPLSIIDELAPTLQNWLLREWIKRASGIIVSKNQLTLIYREIIQAKKDKQPELKIGNYWLNRYANALWLRQPLNEKQIQEKINACIEQVSKKTNLAINALHVQFRQNGERLKINNNKHSHELKKLLNEWKIPPWERNSLPLIYYKGQLVSIGGFFIADADHSSNAR